MTASTCPPVNVQRGEAAIVAGARARILRPTFTALVAAEEELGPLFALVERAGEGQLRLSELVALCWHYRDGLDREAMGEAVMAMGLAAGTKPLRVLLSQILQGRA